MLERDDLRIHGPRNADHPLAAERQRQAKLVAGERDPADPQIGPRPSGRRPGDFEGGQQRDAQKASPGKDAGF
jgi:hypothetical protein